MHKSHKFMPFHLLNLQHLKTARSFLLVFIFLLVPLKFAFAQDAKNEKANIANTNYETTILPDSNDQYPGCKFKGNYVYAAAINLVWNDLKQNILGENIKLKTNERKILHFVNFMNSYPFSKKDLDTTSYYIKSGFGQPVVDLINIEVNRKFPDRSFPNLNFRLKPEELISYAYIYKNVQYENKFEPQFRFTFINQQVKGFYASTPEQRSTIKILRYWSKDKFILKLRLKDPRDELLLAKGFNQENPIEVMKSLRSMDFAKATRPGEHDAFGMPELHFDYDHIFSDLANKEFISPRLSHYKFQFVFEKVKFDLDYNGVRLENEAGALCGGGAPKINKLLILNKPFWLIMKRTNSKNPFFIIGINNAEFMTKSNNPSLN